MNGNPGAAVDCTCVDGTTSHGGIGGASLAAPAGGRSASPAVGTNNSGATGAETCTAGSMGANGASSMGGTASASAGTLTSSGWVLASRATTIDAGDTPMIVNDRSLVSYVGFTNLGLYTWRTTVEEVRDAGTEQLPPSAFPARDSRDIFIPLYSGDAR